MAMNRNPVLSQVELSTQSAALRRVDFCAPHPYKGGGFLELTELPRLAQEAAVFEVGDGFHWRLASHFENAPEGELSQIINLVLHGQIHLVCQRCLQHFPYLLFEEREFVLLSSEEQADAYPIEDDQREPLVASQHFDLLEAIEDEILLSLPLIPKHPEGVCVPNAAFLDVNKHISEGQEKSHNPFKALKNIKKN
jgi:uncharacterized protein